MLPANSSTPATALRSTESLRGQTTIAMAHKPLRVIRVLLRNHEPYCRSSVGCGQLLVERKEPCWPRRLKMCGFLEEKL